MREFNEDDKLMKHREQPGPMVSNPEDARKVGVLGFLDPRSDGKWYAWLPIQTEQGSYIILADDKAMHAGGQSGELGSDMGLINTGFIPIPRGEQPGFDHADAYRREAPTVSRLYVAHTGADRIEIIDCLTNNYVRSLPDLSGVVGVLIDNEQNFLFSSDRGCARVSIYRCSDETLLGRVGVGECPNGLAYDPLRRRLLPATAECLNRRRRSCSRRRMTGPRLLFFSDRAPPAYSIQDTRWLRDRKWLRRG